MESQSIFRGMSAPTVWFYLPYTFTPSHTMSAMEFVTSSNNMWVDSLMHSRLPQVPQESSDAQESRSSSSTALRRRTRIQNAKIPRALLPTKACKRVVRLRNARLPRQQPNLPASLGLLSRASTWDKSPLHGDGWVQELTNSNESARWEYESTVLSESEEDGTPSHSLCGDVQEVVADEEWDVHLTDALFVGEWEVAFIDDGMLVWNEGESVAIEVVDEYQFRLIYVGKTYDAELRADGKLHWSDGDVWSRKRPAYEGDWIHASISNLKLTWKEGEEIDLEAISSRKFRMVYVGVAYTAEICDDELHWSDGDVWRRRSDVAASSGAESVNADTQQSSSWKARCPWRKNQHVNASSWCWPPRPRRNLSPNCRLG